LGLRLWLRLLHMMLRLRLGVHVRLGMVLGMRLAKGLSLHRRVLMRQRRADLCARLRLGRSRLCWSRRDRDVGEPPLFHLEQPANGLELGLEVLESAFVFGAKLFDEALELRLGGIDLLV
jgi:hypothetical protein